MAFDHFIGEMELTFYFRAYYDLHSAHIRLSKCKALDEYVKFVFLSILKFLYFQGHTQKSIYTNVKSTCLSNYDLTVAKARMQGIGVRSPVGRLEQT